MLLFHSEVVAAMEFEHVVLLERTFVNEHFYTLTSGILATLMLLFDSFFATSKTSLLAFSHKLFNLLCLFAHNYCNNIYVSKNSVQS